MCIFIAMLKKKIPWIDVHPNIMWKVVFAFFTGFGAFESKKTPIFFTVVYKNEYHFYSD